MDRSEVQVRSMRAFHTGDRCKPQSRFMDFPFFLIPCLHCILVFRHSLLHGPSCFSDVCELAFTAGHFIDNIPFLLHWGLMLHLHYYAPQCLRGSDGGLHP